MPQRVIWILKQYGLDTMFSEFAASLVASVLRRATTRNFRRCTFAPGNLHQDIWTKIVFMKLRPPSIFFVFEILSIPETIGQLEKKVIDYLQQLAEDESLSLRVHCPAYQ